MANHWCDQLLQVALLRKQRVDRLRLSLGKSEPLTVTHRGRYFSSPPRRVKTVRTAGSVRVSARLPWCGQARRAGVCGLDWSLYGGIGRDDGEDVVLGDNGAVTRPAPTGLSTTLVDGGTTDRVSAQRYGASRAGRAKVRVAGGGAVSTRFCTATANPTASSTCEVAGSRGKDTIVGDAGQDVLYGQDGDDTIWGGVDDDDLCGELGADVLFGEDGEDAIVGDRGGVQNRYEDGSRSISSTLTQPPAVTYISRRSGSVSREADLLHDVNGIDFAAGCDRDADAPGRDHLRRRRPDPRWGRSRLPPRGCR